MVKDLVGFRFSPMDKELINYYLKNKILDKPWLVDEAISEINLCSHEPFNLPRLSKLESDNLTWHFFSRIEYTNEKKIAMKRLTGSGFWKPTGKDRKIRDKRGNGVVIGLKKTLVYHKGRSPNGVRTPWVMHEYHITCLPQDKRTYVICKVMNKGEDGDIPSGGNYSNQPSQSLVSDSNTIRATINTSPEFEQPGQENLDGLSMDDLMIPMNEQEDLCPSDVLDNNHHTVQPQAPHFAPNDDEFLGGLRHVDRRHVEHLFANEEFISRPATSMTEHRNDHRPKKPLSGIIVGYSSDSDSDAESISTTSYQGTSSPGDSVGSPNKFFLSCSSTGSCQDLQTVSDPSVSRESREYKLTQRTVPSKQEVKQEAPRAIDVSMVKTEKKGWFITEEAIERNRKNPQCICLMRRIVGFFCC